MFSFFKKKPAPAPAPAPGVPAPVDLRDFSAPPVATPDAPRSPSPVPPAVAPIASPGPALPVTPAVAVPVTSMPPASLGAAPPAPVVAAPVVPAAPLPVAPVPAPPAPAAPVPAAPAPAAPVPAVAPAPQTIAPPVYARPAPAAAPVVPPPAPEPAPERAGWLSRLRQGLAKTGSSIAQVFTGTRIDDDLYEELEAALLMADAGVKATEFLLADLKRRVKERKAESPAEVRSLLADALTDLLAPLQRSLVVGEQTPTVMMVVGVNGAGKTTSIGKLTRHLADSEQKVLLAAADTFRAAAREQLAIWADRNQVQIISQEGGDPAAVTYDAVVAGKARGADVVIADTAGRLPTQLHLMEELKKIRRTITKADGTAPHEVLLVVDGNTGQNALTQVKAFDDALQLTGLVVTKLDGTAKGGVLAAIARERPIPVYFVGVGEKLEDLQTFSAREFAQALLG